MGSDFFLKKIKSSRAVILFNSFLLLAALSVVFIEGCHPSKGGYKPYHGTTKNPKPTPTVCAENQYVLTVKNYAGWCTITVNGSEGSISDSLDVCVENGYPLLTATPVTGFMLGPWYHTTGDTGVGEYGTLSGDIYSTSTTTATINGSNTCVEICCPFRDGSGCPTSFLCP